MRSRRRRALALLCLAAAAGVAGPSPLLAASPSPSGPPDLEHPGRPAIQVWLDAPLPVAPEPGDVIDVGATLWDPEESAVARMGATLFLRAIPADAAGEPIQATAISDWPGHYRGRVEVPPGGLGDVQLGLTGTICENDVCRPDDWVFGIAGDGPPPDAPITMLAEARIGVDDADVGAGEPVDVTVVLVPNASWDELPLPDTVVLRAREARGPNVAVARLPLADAAGLIYAGSITIPRSGELVLEAATDEDGGDATRFGTSMIRVDVGDGSVGAGGETPTPGGSPDDGIPLPLILLMVLAALVGGGVILAGFRSGNR